MHETGLDELLKWLEEFDNLPFKPTYRNTIEKIWQIQSKQNQHMLKVFNKINTC